MIQISFSEIEKLINSLSILTKEKLPVKTAYKLVKLLKKIDEEYKIFIEQRSKIINEYSEKDDKGNIIVNKDNDTNSIPIKNEFIKQCELELKELYQISFDIDFSLILIDELGEIKFSMEDLYILDKFFI
jgi:hypothetical protein